MKKNGKLGVCIDFRNLNLATPKDEYPMPVCDLLVDSASTSKVSKSGGDRCNSCGRAVAGCEGRSVTVAVTGTVNFFIFRTI